MHHAPYKSAAEKRAIFGKFCSLPGSGTGINAVIFVTQYLARIISFMYKPRPSRPVHNVSSVVKHFIKTMIVTLSLNGYFVGIYK